MIIKKATINNFKSIENVELDFDKVGNSYTKIFVGLNESGKSNILEALSYYNVPEGNYSFKDLCNQKFIDDTECLDITFQLDFEEKEDYNMQFKETYNSHPDFIFTLKNITKKIYLKRDSNSFVSQFKWDIELPSTKFYTSNIPHNPLIMGEPNYTIDKVRIYDPTEDTLLTQERFKKLYNEFIENYIKEHEPKVSIWNSSDRYLITAVDLKQYANDINSNKPLKNIFNLGGIKDEHISKVIKDIQTSSKDRSRYVSKLNNSLNRYIHEIWNNNINILIEITETAYFSILIIDKGKENEDNRFTMLERSQGAKQFLSLILSLSLETKNQERKNELILIDEPEVHLHPSGIRDLSKELLKIGQDNYIFLATHSPFIIDKQHPKRHYIVKKNNKAITEITRIEDANNLLDDEVLKEAFGINVYRDLLIPHRVLVEGASDKKILKKAFEILGRNDIGIKNGCGNNIVTLSSNLNFEGISMLVIVDDDEEGQLDKEKIIKIGGVFNKKNVFTIHDLVNDIIQNGTIEDTLDPQFVVSTFKEFYKETFNKTTDFTLRKGIPVIPQIESKMKGEEENRAIRRTNMNLFKANLAEKFFSAETNQSEGNERLYKLAQSIIMELDSL